MKKVIALSGACVFVGMTGLSSVSAAESNNPENDMELMSVTSVQENMVGGDRDAHNCIGSAGYNWSESNGKCIRPWEEVGNTEKRLSEKLTQQVYAKVEKLSLEKLNLVISNITKAVKKIKASNISTDKKSGLLIQLYQVESIVQDQIDILKQKK